MALPPVNPGHFFGLQNLNLASSFVGWFGQLILAGLLSFLTLRRYVPFKRFWLGLQIMLFVRAWIPGFYVINAFHPFPWTYVIVKMVGDLSLVTLVIIAVTDVPELSSLLRYRSQARIDRMQNMESTQDLTQELTDMTHKRASDRARGHALLDHVA